MKLERIFCENIDCMFPYNVIYQYAIHSLFSRNLGLIILKMFSIQKDLYQYIQILNNFDKNKANVYVCACVNTNRLTIILVERNYFSKVQVETFFAYF